MVVKIKRTCMNLDNCFFFLPIVKWYKKKSEISLNSHGFVVEYWTEVIRDKELIFPFTGSNN